MTKYFSMIERSKPDAWRVEVLPPYLAEIQQLNDPLEEPPYLLAEKPTSLLVFRDDVRISVAMGRIEEEEFNEDWATGFSDKKATLRRADFLFSGSLIYSCSYVSVDGGRCDLPLLSSGKLTVPKRFNRAMQIFHQARETGCSYSNYIVGSRATIVDEEWPV
ncbi:hypothetical protein [Ruegeria sp. ANG-S4]|uniref:hypothetical protein n=1 Tax=Ruegeria sp. ANG-S4 TaxID=1577904 RepID=UPI00187D0B80|nr:hypothetical protein [Ruegeria sp. ANG-S4]